MLALFRYIDRLMTGPTYWEKPVPLVAKVSSTLVQADSKRGRWMLLIPLTDAADAMIDLTP
jgi:hypothetical protein